MEDFGPLRTALRRVFPDCQLEPITEPELTALRKLHPGVPEHYLAFLRQVGYGSLSGTFMLYDGLCTPDDIFDPQTAASLDGILFFGDNFAGWMVGFDTRANWRIVGVDSYFLEPHPEEAKTVGEFIAQRIANQEEPKLKTKIVNGTKPFKANGPKGPTKDSPVLEKDGIGD